MIRGAHFSREHLRSIFGGVPNGRNGISCPGPGHSRHDRSMSILIKPDGLIVNSFADDWAECEDYVRLRLGLPAFEPSGSPARPVAPASPPPSAPPPDDDDEKQRRKLALRIWREADEPDEDSPVARYLAKRGLAPMPEALGAALRWHPSAPFAGSRTGCMIALARDIITNERRAIHRTAIDAAGTKLIVNGESRRALGPIAGAAIKLTPDEDVITCLGIGEGIETVLSMRALPEFGPSPVWALISAGGVAAFPVLAGIECLWVAVDRDPAGERAADEVADRWRRAGREVFLVRPQRERADLNDIIREVPGDG